ncbi:Uncharacterized protein SCF082_LOCUS5598 [Durusdinium trenchii]|uniref:Phytanoyl-CoA dioxygenase family protein n=1 Tax=Durusdinium trenchii TaxID=1381693 RepID=A0ABP0I9U7_9DINO
MLFDLNGFVVLRGVLSREEVAAANAGIDAHAERLAERRGGLRNTKDNTPLAGDMRTGRLDLGGMLGWDAPHRDVFRKMLAHPGVVPLLHELVGHGYRLDHSPLVIAQDRGSEGFSLHGGPVDANGRLIPSLQYRCQNGGIFNTLVAVSFQLTDHNAGDGGFCVVRGSHKMNFAASADMVNGEDREFFETCVDQPVTKAGDVVLFSEATMHGSLPWTAAFQRRIALYRFSPCNVAYARGYSEGWPASFTDGMDEAQLGVMQPPFHEMFDRPLLAEDGSASADIRRRAQHKKDFDVQVFGETYY